MGQTHAVAGVFQQLAQQIGDVRFVLDHQQAASAVASGRPDGFAQHRQLEPETGALAHDRVEADLAAHTLDQLLADGQAEPGTAFAAAVAGIGLGELAENALAKFGGDARSLVDHFDAHAGASMFGAQLYLGAGRRVLHGVGNEVGQHLLQAHGVDPHARRQAIEQT